ncbi:MAG TPA: amidohydrolase family protein [Xanthobacteraceae bacterium]|nr:amidohydrolase family protein [Xanthobacteraceae bacterium]
MDDHSGHVHDRAIDIHAHYFAQSYLDLFNEQREKYGTDYRPGKDGWHFKSPIAEMGPLPNRMVDIKERVAEMDATSIAVQALSLTMPMVYWAEPEFSHKLARAWNDDAVAAHKAYPDRFVVFATLPMLHPDRAIDELNRVSKLPGVRGVYMGTNIDGRDLDDPLFAPIFARIEALDLPVFLHPQQTVGGKRLGVFYLSNFLGNPFDSAIAACHLIFGGVLDRHPKLQFNLPHAGGALPGLIGRIDHGWKMRPETRHLANAPSTYLRRFTYDTISHSLPIMEFIISMVGADRIMIGSDYCFDMGYERPREMVDRLRVSTADRALIRGGTAAKILKL